ncbi:MAG: hypothetical protein EA376_00570 [Phycisphaeraceae bacterium]|nr:MAG: hypothetical protein EA376_00570 [Phycisphaeraceae bacterium]
MSRRSPARTAAAAALLTALAGFGLTSAGCSSAAKPVSMSAPRLTQDLRPLPVRVEADGLEGVGRLGAGSSEAVSSARSALTGLLGEAPHFRFVPADTPESEAPTRLRIHVEYLDVQTAGTPGRRIEIEPGGRSGPHNQPANAPLEGIEQRYGAVSCRVTVFLEYRRADGAIQTVASSRGYGTWSSRRFLLPDRNVTGDTPVIYRTIEEAAADALQGLLRGGKLATVERYMRDYHRGGTLYNPALPGNVYVRMRTPDAAPE